MSVTGQSGPTIPYQMVQYIQMPEGQPNSYFDLDYIPDAETGMLLDLVGAVAGDKYIMGTRQGTGQTRFDFGYEQPDGYYITQGRFVTHRHFGTTDVRRTLYLNYKNDGKARNDAGVEYPLQYPFTWTATGNIWLFGSSAPEGGSPFYSVPATVYHAQITQGSAIVRDLYPIRIGTEGCLYDAVSETVIHLTGSASLVLGPDIN